MYLHGTVLLWFPSYFTNRTQTALIDDVYSDKFDVEFGVPQGWCLNPLLFTIHTSELFKIIENHLPNCHCYADDTQLYLAFKPGSDCDQAAAVSAMESCIADIRRWMLSKKLKLNDDKTEFLIIGTRQQLEKVNVEELCVGSYFINPSSVVKNLGSWFDSKLNMLVHINKICSSSFFYFNNFRRIRKYLTRQDTECLVHAFISSKIDYCNGLLYGLPTSATSKLQCVQNAAARLVTGSPRFCHITPVLESLH